MHGFSQIPGNVMRITRDVPEDLKVVNVMRIPRSFDIPARELSRKERGRRCPLISSFRMNEQGRKEPGTSIKYPARIIPRRMYKFKSNSRNERV